MMNRFIGALIALSLVGCNADLAPQPPLQGARMGGAFTLISEDGTSVRESDFTGKYRLVYFGYSFCPDVCPVDVQKLMLGLKHLEKSDPSLAAKIQPIFISVDPKRDTPAVLREFTDAFHPRLIGLTGSAEAIGKVASDYGIYFQLGEEKSKGAYLVDHSRQATLYGPKGEPIALIPEQGSPREIADQLSRWIR